MTATEISILAVLISAALVMFAMGISIIKDIFDDF